MMEYMCGQPNEQMLHYVSNLEAQIIKAKFNSIISSLTFKYSRQEDVLALIPDKIGPNNLRINSFVKLRDQASEQGFFKSVYGDPSRPQEIDDLVISILDAVEQDTQVGDESAEQMRALVAKKLGHAVDPKYLANKLSMASFIENKDDLNARLIDEIRDTRPYTVNKKPMIAGVEPAKRTKYQLIAAVLFHIDFWLRKVHRRTDLFHGSSQAS